MSYLISVSSFVSLQVVFVRNLSCCCFQPDRVFPCIWPHTTDTVRSSLHFLMKMLVVGDTVDNDNKKLSYRRGTARCVVSIEILPIATQQCKNYLYDKS